MTRRRLDRNLRGLITALALSVVLWLGILIPVARVAWGWPSW